MKSIVETASLKQCYEKKHNLKPLWETLFYVSLFVFSVICFYVFKPLFVTGDIKNGLVAQIFGGVLISITLIVFLCLVYLKKVTISKSLLFIVIIGFILRLTYILYTPASIRQHDTFTENEDGHFNYTWTIYATGKLPSSNVYQFYHPPLNAIIQAGFMHLSNAFAKIFNVDITKYLFGKASYISDNQYFLYQTCQLLGLFYSFIAGVFSIKILKLFNVKGLTLILVSLFVMLYPRTIQISGQLNNDALSFMLAILSLYFAVRWYKLGKKFVDIILCGIFLGLGMCTKLSMATVALPIAGIFIVEFISTIKKSENSLKFSQMFLQYSVFLVICASLGLWFQIYANIRFGQEFGYVLNPFSSVLYTGNVKLWKRFLIAFDKNEWFGSVFCNVSDNYNLYNYLIKSSLFGETTYLGGKVFAILAVTFTFICILFTIVVSIYYFVIIIKSGNLVKKAKIKFGKIKDLIFIFLLISSQILSEIYFYYKLPYGCTMDFRYIMPIILGIALYFGEMLNKFRQHNTKTSKIVELLLYINVSCMILFSSIFYLTCN